MKKIHPDRQNRLTWESSNDLGKGSSVYFQSSNQDIPSSLSRMALARVCPIKSLRVLGGANDTAEEI